MSGSGVDISALRSDLCTALRLARNADGGWAYHPSKSSRIEPTCWALLALGQVETIAPDFEVLRRWPRQGGWLMDAAGAPANHSFNAIAALTLLQSASSGPLAEAVIRRVVVSRGIRVQPQPEVPLDSSLQAWSWVEGTFSWVEPTAWSVLLLKQRLARGPYPDAAARVRVGEQMLNDRACRDGGWNYGNSIVYGQDLMPYVPTTALALLALQDKRREATVARGLDRLQRDIVNERSVMALSLAIICLRIHGVPTPGPEQELVKLVWQRQADMELNHDVLGLAMALCALGDRPPAAFRLGVA